MFRVGDPPVAHAYEDYFGLVESPFGLTPNPRFRFESRSHAAALDEVTQALRRREALVVITGEVGTGKTLLCRTVLQRLERRTFVCVVSNPRLTGDDLLQQMLTDFGVASPDPTHATGARTHDLIQTLERFLGSLATLRAHAVVLIDEAQHLRPAVLEQIRLLSNFETASSKLLQIILVGQPELEALLRQPEMRQLEQRISRRHQLQPLDEGEVRHYVERRLWVAHGGLEALLDAPATKDERAAADAAFWRVRFTPAALRAVAAITSGIPRLVNVLCDRSLELAHQQRRRTVEAADVLAAAGKLKLAVPLRQRLPGASTAAAAVAIAAGTAALMAAGTLGWDRIRQPREVQASVVTPAPAAAPLTRVPAPRSAAPQATPAIPVAAAAQPLPEAEAFTVVAASFRTASRAARLAERFAGDGLPAFTRLVDGGWHQVIVGPYASRDEARRAQEQIENEEISGTRLVARAPRADAPRAEAAVTSVGDRTP